MVRGTKRRCPSCGAPYYDLNRDPITCPKCHALYVETHKVPVRASSRSRLETPIPVEPAEDVAPFDDEGEIPEADDHEEDEDIDRSNDQDDDMRD